MTSYLGTDENTVKKVEEELSMRWGGEPPGRQGKKVSIFIDCLSFNM